MEDHGQTEGQGGPVAGSPIRYEDEVPPVPETPPAAEPEPPAKAVPKVPTVAQFRAAAGLVPEPRAGGAPAWANIPEGLAFPRGRQAMFIRIAARWTDTPWIGMPLPSDDEQAIRIAGEGGLWRQCICWPCNIGDIKHATSRSMSDSNRFADEMAKQMIRSVDGHRADWGGMPGPGNIDQWWDQVGHKNRNLLHRIWSQLHIHTREAQVSFFESCIEVVSPG